MVAKVHEKIATLTEPPSWTITSDKINAVWKVEKTFDGFVFFKIGITKGKLPEELQGRFTAAEDAIKAVVAYEKTAKKTSAKQRDESYAKRSKGKNASVHTNTDEHVRERVAD